MQEAIQDRNGTLSWSPEFGFAWTMGCEPVQWYPGCDDDDWDTCSPIVPVSNQVYVHALTRMPIVHVPFQTIASADLRRLGQVSQLKSGACAAGSWSSKKE